LGGMGGAETVEEEGGMGRVRSSSIRSRGGGGLGWA
jgi:hypothetical protein